MEAHYVPVFNKIIEETMEEHNYSAEDLRDNKIIRENTFFLCLGSELVTNMPYQDKKMFWRYFEREFGSIAREQ